jgi:hypothetical protein
VNKVIEYTVKVYGNRTEWYLNGELHREDGPAIEWASGTKNWFINGKFHREDGPAREWADGTKFWYLNGELHREGEPAIEWYDGDKSWWLNGEQVTKDEVMGKTITIDGKEIKISNDSFNELKKQLIG